ncbi:unnamed protein product [Closterium sp. Yama58-4]|nr:unnamed protein product [Closterium sp. Yama58-4]
MALSRSHTLTLLAVLLVLAVCANGAPTVTQFRQELTALRAVVKQQKNYSAFARGIDRMLKYPDSLLPQIFNTTLFIPTNRAILSLGIPTLKNDTAMEAIGKYNVLVKQFTGAQLLKLAPNTLLKTKAKDMLMRYPSTGANAGKIVLGPQSAPAAKQGVVLTADLYTGKFLKAHGLSVLTRRLRKLAADTAGSIVGKTGKDGGKMGGAVVGDGATGGSTEGRMLVSGFIQLMMSQVSSRVVTFLMNLVIARRLSPQEFGMAAVQFQLLTSTILFVSREGFRRGCLRADGNTPSSSSSASSSASPLYWARMVSAAWLVVPTGIALAAAACAFVLHYQHLPLSDPYAQAILLHGVAAAVELLSEPLYILSQALLLVRLRAVLDAVATVVRCVVTLLLVLGGIGRTGGLVFAYAELAFSTTLVIGYWGFFLLHPSVRALGPRGENEAGGGSAGEGSGAMIPLLPCKLPERPLLHWPLLRLCGAFALQAMVKQVLGKGDEMVLVAMESAYNQGVYGLVVKLGSLVVRSVLQPFEESAFIIFARTAPSLASASHTPHAADAAGKEGSTSKSGRESVARVLLLAVKAVNVLGLIFVAFGPPFSYSLFSLLYGPTWTATEAPLSLACYCPYIMALALNGTTEAFVHAVLSERQLAQSNGWLLLFSLLHMALSALLIRVASSPGLILANCCNMAMRIAYSATFINQYFKTTPNFSLWHSLPSFPVLSSFAAASLISFASQHLLLFRGSYTSPSSPPSPLSPASLAHIAVGALCFAAVIGALWHWERKFFAELKATLRSAKASKQE